VTGRPGPHTSMPLVLLEAQSHGGRSVALDQSFGSAAGTRVRLIAEQSRLHASAPGTEGDAHGLALAVDQDLGVWQLEVDLQARRQAQLTQPGAQLLGGSELPPVSPDRSLGFSSWSQPTVFRSRLAQLRLSRNLSMLAPGWQLHLGLSDHSVTTDDRSSFPWGCSNGTDPYFLFCSNGDFTLWDYQSLGEHRSMRAIQTTAYGPLRLMGHVGIASLGLASANRQTHLPQYSWQPTDAGLVDTGNVFSGTWTGQPLPAVPYEAFRSELRQQSLSLSWTGRAGPVGVPVPSLTMRLVEALQGYESAFWTPRPWTSTRDSQVLGAAGLSLPISADERISLSWREDLEAGQRVPVTAANDGELLPPRTLSALELGYKWARSSRERLSITVFRSTRPYDLRQDEQSVPAYPGPYIRQGRESRTGLEWVAQQALSTAWRLEWTGSWTDSEVSGTGLQWLDGTEVSNLPRLRSRLRLEARSAAGGPEVQLAVTGVSGRWATRGETVRVPGYARLDLGLGLPMTGLGRGARAQLAVQNVLDRRYWADASEFLGDAYLTPGSSRTLTLSLSLPL
jgi:iron complex outermembrane receptor protein